MPYDPEFGLFIQDEDGALWRGFFADLDEAKRTAQKLANIRRPSEKIMLAEEPASAADAPPGSTVFLDDGRWLPAGNVITIRHNKKGNVNFADGHAQAVDYKFASDTNHFDTSF